MENDAPPPEEDKQNEEQEEEQEEEEEDAGEHKGRAEYRKKEFWDRRYLLQEGYYDWYLEYEEMKKVFEQCFPINKDDKILIVGCGNSKLSEDLYDAGYRNTVSIDISEVVIEKMNEISRKAGKQITYTAMDATAMAFGDGEFDVVIDKGTLDALVCGRDYAVPHAMLREMARVAKKRGGQVLVVTYGTPQERADCFKDLGTNAFRYRIVKKQLSPMSQLVNIIRASSHSNRPIGEVLRDKNALFDVLKQLRDVKKNLKEGQLVPQDVDWSHEDIDEGELPDATGGTAPTSNRRRYHCFVYQITHAE